MNMSHKLILVCCIIFSILFPLIPSSTSALLTNTRERYIGSYYSDSNHYNNVNNDTIQRLQECILVLNVSEFPFLKGVHVGSLSLGIYNGSIWIFSDVYIYNGSRKAYSPLGMRLIEIPNAGWLLTDNTVLIIKIPVVMHGIYTSKWPNLIARHGVHNRLYIELPSINGTVGFFLFYDKQDKGLYHIRYLVHSEYMELIKNASKLGVLFKEKDIITMKNEHVSSFIVSNSLDKILGINETYREYIHTIVSNYLKFDDNMPWKLKLQSSPYSSLVNLAQSMYQEIYNIVEKHITYFIRRPPIYMDGGGGGSGGQQSPPPPKEEYLFNIIVYMGPVNNTRLYYSVYLGSNISNAELKVQYSTSKPVNFHMRLVLYDTASLSIRYNKSFTIELKPGSNDFIVSLNIPYNKKTYRLNITFWADDVVKGIYMYIYLSKDFSGPYKIAKTPETKLAFIGYGDYNELVELRENESQSYLWYISWGLVKGYDTCFIVGESPGCMDEVVVLATPLTNGLYYYASPDEFYLDIVFAYAIPPSYKGGEYVVIYINGYKVANITLDPYQDLMRFYISLTYVKSIFYNALKSNKPLILSIKSPLLLSNKVFFTVPQAYFVIPYHPEVWKPKSQNFVSLPHMGSYGGSYIYSYVPDIRIQTYASGIVSYALGFREYGIDYSYVHVPVDVLLDVFAKGVDLVTSSGVKEDNKIVYARLDLWLPKKAFGYSLPYDFQGEILKGRQANKWLTKAVEIAEETYKAVTYISAAIEIVSGGQGLPYTSTLGVIVDTLKASLCQKYENVKDEKDWRHYILEWRGNAQPIEFGRFRMLIGGLDLASNGVVKAKITIATKENCPNPIVIESKILYGHVTRFEYRSGYAITGYVFVKR